MARHVCENKFAGEGARGGSFFEIDSPTYEHGTANVRVGHSCVIVHDAQIPITWIAELFAIATEHKGGLKGFLEERSWSGQSYALMCDPEVPPKGTYA